MCLVQTELKCLYIIYVGTSSSRTGPATSLSFDFVRPSAILRSCQCVPASAPAWVPVPVILFDCQSEPEPGLRPTSTSRLFHAQMLNMCNKVIALFLLSLNRDSLFVAPQRYDPGEKPVFDDHLPSNVTVQQGDTAYLHCRIFNAENMYV